jgi:hypothetical protein
MCLTSDLARLRDDDIEPRTVECQEGIAVCMVVKNCGTGRLFSQKTQSSVRCKTFQRVEGAGSRVYTWRHSFVFCHF